MKVSIKYAAEVLRVCPTTLYLWEEQGKVTPDSRTLGGHRRYDLDELYAVRRQMDCGRDERSPCEEE